MPWTPQWDSTGRFIVLRVASQSAIEAPESGFIARRLLEVAGDRPRLPILVRVDDALPPGLDWRLAWMRFVVENRRELRIALLRKGFATQGIGKWGQLAGVEIQDFSQEEEAIAWLTRA